MNRTGFKIIISCVLLIFFFSCSQHEKNGEHNTSVLGNAGEANRQQKALDVNAYMNWIESKENGLKVEKKIGEVTFSALYKPYEYMAVMELKKDSLTEKNIKRKLADYDGLQYFTFKITANNEQKELLKIGISSDQEYYARLEYFSFQMQKDFKLIDGADTLDCVLYHFERVYGLAPYATMVLGFPLSKTRTSDYKNKTIGYMDKLFGAGNVYMTVEEEDLNNMPSLAID